MDNEHKNAAYPMRPWFYSYHSKVKKMVCQEQKHIEIS
jgi:hypothetical protein